MYRELLKVDTLSIAFGFLEPTVLAYQAKNKINGYVYTYIKFPPCISLASLSRNWAQIRQTVMVWMVATVITKPYY